MGRPLIRQIAGRGMVRSAVQAITLGIGVISSAIVKVRVQGVTEISGGYICGCEARCNMAPTVSNVASGRTRKG